VRRPRSQRAAREVRLEAVRERDGTYVEAEERPVLRERAGNRRKEAVNIRPRTRPIKIATGVIRRH